jgi:hypothetical protein
MSEVDMANHDPVKVNPLDVDLIRPPDDPKQAVIV